MPGVRRRTQQPRNQQGEAMSNYQSNQIKLINTSLIDPHPDNPRKNIGDVTDLADSIKTNGLLTPLSVVPNGERYRVIAGHRRLAACKQAGTGAVPCFVLDLDPLQQLEAMVTENCQREQLTVLEEADAIQGMLDLGATTADVAHRLGRSADYVRDRAKAASIDNEVRASRDDFSQLTIGQLVAIARYDGRPDLQKKLAQAAGTSNFDYTLSRIERDENDRQWIESVAALLVESDNGINLIPDPEKPYSDPEWRYAGCMFPSTGTPEEAIEKIRELNPAAVSIHTVSQQVYLWTRRDKTADAEKEARRAAEQAERDARRHALEEYAAASADKRMAWLHGHLHGIKRDKLVETTARLGLLQTIDPDPTGFTNALSTWNDAACAQKQFATIAGIKPEQALAELHTHLDSPDWPTYAVMILTARIEWFISPNDWDWSGDDNVSRRIPGYYLILQDLGYEPSDDETEHLDQLVAAITEEDEEEDE
nr:MAG TPA: chromosome partitioning protein [Caudoviricetes sp.]